MSNSKLLPHLDQRSKLGIITNKFEDCIKVIMLGDSRSITTKNRQEMGDGLICLIVASFTIGSMNILKTNMK